MKMLVVCDYCTLPFESKLEETALEIGGVTMWFGCPHCDTVYPVARLSARGVEIRAELQETQDGDRQRELRALLKAEVTDERVKH